MATTEAKIVIDEEMLRRIVREEINDAIYQHESHRQYTWRPTIPDPYREWNPYWPPQVWC